MSAAVPQPAVAAGDALHTLYGATMGTRWRVLLRAPARTALDPLHATVQRVLDGVVARMSDWEPDSDLSRFNAAPAGSWVALPADLAQVLQCALQVARASGGAFDPTLSPLVALWGFGAHARPRTRPDAAGIAAARARCGWQRLQLRTAPDAALQPGGLRLDLSGIAKGHAADAVAAALRDAGIRGALVDIGGELVGFGRRPDRSCWRVLVEADAVDAGEDADHAHPAADAVTGEAVEACVLRVDGRAVATSGARWHAWRDGGGGATHTIDPRSGQPVDAAVAVTVVADHAVHADAWATALAVMGGDAFAFASEHAIAARIVDRTPGGARRVRSTPAFDALRDRDP